MNYNRLLRESSSCKEVLGLGHQGLLVVAPMEAELERLMALMEVCQGMLPKTLKI
jgi:hypothetical protein